MVELKLVLARYTALIAFSDAATAAKIIIHNVFIDERWSNIAYKHVSGPRQSGIQHFLKRHPCLQGLISSMIVSRRNSARSLSQSRMLCWAITVTFHTSPCLFPCSSSDGENTEKAYFVLPIELFHRNMFKAFGGRSRSAEV
ncbi:hypothetical protein EDD16DRAFT_118839 [Pisolithus croceorrhizus]|nr:hypothetical protein EDD16DRAFT_118839 [Pisolithus croceorrhizus]